MTRRSIHEELRLRGLCRDARRVANLHRKRRKLSRRGYGVGIGDPEKRNLRLHGRALRRSCAARTTGSTGNCDGRYHNVCNLGPRGIQNLQCHLIWASVWRGRNPTQLHCRSARPRHADATLHCLVCRCVSGIYQLNGQSRNILVCASIVDLRGNVDGLADGRICRIHHDILRSQRHCTGRSKTRWQRLRRVSPCS